MPIDEEQKKILESLPPAHHTFFVAKASRKTTDQKLSHFTVYRDNAKSVMSFFIEHNKNKKYPGGGYASRVKKAYLTVDAKPKYAIKIYHQNMFAGNTVHEMRLAMRSAYCYKQLGRESACFRIHEKQYLLTEWLRGGNLFEADQKKIQSMPIPRRIVMAISLLRELSILHRQGLIHHDIKPHNVMINYGRLGFVDLDSVTPKGEPPLVGPTPIYTKRYLPTAEMSFHATYHPTTLFLKFDEKTDLRQLGRTLCSLFQEIYVPTKCDQIIQLDNSSDTYNFETVVLVYGKEYSKHPQLQKLLKQITSLEYSSPATADECIEAFMKILSTYPDFEEYLKEDRLVDVGKNLSSTDGEKAFKEIEIELLGYNKRCKAAKKLTLS